MRTWQFEFNVFGWDVNLHFWRIDIRRQHKRRINQHRQFNLWRFHDLNLRRIDVGWEHDLYFWWVNLWRKHNVDIGRNHDLDLWRIDIRREHRLDFGWLNIWRKHYFDIRRVHDLGRIVIVWRLDLDQHFWRINWLDEHRRIKHRRFLNDQHIVHKRRKHLFGWKHWQQLNRRN